jgi:hypothetical protein
MMDLLRSFFVIMVYSTRLGEQHIHINVIYNALTFLTILFYEIGYSLNSFLGKKNNHIFLQFAQSESFNVPNE